MWEFSTLQEKVWYSEYEEVFEWYLETPSILRANWQFEDDKLKFVEDLENGMNFVAKKDGIFVAMVHGQPKSTEIIEGHLFCLPGTCPELLTAFVTYAKTEALKKYKVVTTQTPTKHRGMLKLNERAGFMDSGYRSWNTVYRGKLLTIQHNLATK